MSPCGVLSNFGLCSLRSYAASFERNIFIVNPVMRFKQNCSCQVPRDEHIHFIVLFSAVQLHDAQPSQCTRGRIGRPGWFLHTGRFLL